MDELSEKLGVSLTPVRNAIQQLASEGLVEIQPRSGTFVAKLSVQDIEETFEIRCALECLAAEKATNSMKSADLDRLRALLVSLDRPIEDAEGRKAHEQANLEFHRILVRASGNRRLQDIYEGLNAHLKIARIHGSEQSWRSRLGEERAEHLQIVTALENRDANLVAATLRKHIYRAKDALVASVRKTE